MSAAALMPTLRTVDADFEARFAQRLQWSAQTDEAIEQRVAQLLTDVRDRGDQALLEATRQFDRMPTASMASLTIDAHDMAQAFANLPA
ncbi:MAG: histidinol dehydrogenase, partial [Burkholderiaceae bacterium]